VIISLKILSDSHETKTDAVAVVNLLFDEMANLLANGNKVKMLSTVREFTKTTGLKVNQSK
jgi:nucleoid DNA-binding protein